MRRYYLTILGLAPVSSLNSAILSALSPSMLYSMPEVVES